MAILALVLFFGREQAPLGAARVRLVGFTSSNSTTILTLVITNAGRGILEATSDGSSLGPDHQFERVEWWSAARPAVAHRDFFQYVNGICSGLVPGDSVVYHLGVPAEAQRVRVGFWYGVQNPRTAMALRLHRWGIWHHFQRLCDKLVMLVPAGGEDYGARVYWTEITPLDSQ